MIKFVVLFLVLAIPNCLAQEAQNTNGSKNAINHRLGIYPELLGNGGGFSGNIEYLLSFKEDKRCIYLRGGIGYGIENSTTLIESGLLIGNGTKYLEIGLGYTKLGVKNESDSEYFYVLRLGYRYQGKKGLLVRAAPMLINKYEPDGSEYQFWFGLGVGYSLQLNSHLR
jgi:hypothetical protein